VKQLFLRMHLKETSFQGKSKMKNKTLAYRQTARQFLFISHDQRKDPEVIRSA